MPSFKRLAEVGIILASAAYTESLQNTFATMQFTSQEELSTSQDFFHDIFHCPLKSYLNIQTEGFLQLQNDLKTQASGLGSHGWKMTWKHFNKNPGPHCGYEPVYIYLKEIFESVPTTFQDPPVKHGTCDEGK